MNILYLCDEYPPGRIGGIGTSVQLLARQMVKLGHKVIVAGLYTPGFGGADEFEDEGVKVYRYRWGMDMGFFANQLSFSVRVTNRVLNSTGIMQWDIKRSLGRYHLQLENIIAREQIDVVEMPDYNDYVRFCRSVVPFPQLSIPVVVKMNGSLTYFNRETGKPVAGYVLKMEQHILNQAAAVAAVSKYTAEKSGGYLSYSKPIEVLHNGIDTDIPDSVIKRSPWQVIFTGSLVEKKGIYQLARAWNMVNKAMPAARLHILGKGPQQKVAELFTPEALHTITFMGHVDKVTLYNQLFASAVSVFPSYAEAFALAPLEAMACGTAVINSNRTSGPELVDDKVNGLLIDPDNVEQIAEAILLLLSDADLRTQLAIKGNATVRAQFNIGRIAEMNLAFYKKVLNKERK
jgi:glycosyltransferase involved in cell wall biosynthesis